MTSRKSKPLDRLRRASYALDEQATLLDDYNAFVEAVIKDQDGAPLRQGDIHRRWFAHVERCRSRNVWAGLLCPWGHGKSVNMAIAYPAWRLAQNQGLRVKVLSASDDIAVGRVSAIKNLIDNPSSEYRRIFPRVKADPRRAWTSRKIYLDHPGDSPEPSLEALSVLSSRMGARADLIIFDDVVDLQNAIQRPIMREKVKDAFYSGWLSRLEPRGEVIYIGTVWHENDLSMELLSNKAFSFLIQSISDDFSAIECRITNDSAS